MTLTADKLENIQTSATNRRIHEIISSVNAGKLLPRPDFQRKLVWTNQDKIHFLDTILKHLPFPEIYVCAGEINTETAQGTEWLVDGQQRVTTIIAYFSADPTLRLGSEILPYKKLDPKEQERFLAYIVVVRDLGKLDIEDVREVFQRINSTHYGLNAMELANARWDGAIKKYVQTLAENDFFADHRVFTTSDIRRMMDASFCLSLVVTMDSGYFDDTAEHASYLEKFNDEFAKKPEFDKRIGATIAFVKSMSLPAKSRWWKKADLFTLLVEVDDLLNRKGKPLLHEKAKEALLLLEEDIKRASNHDDNLQADKPRFELVSKYAYAAAQGSNHRKSRRDRGDVVRELLTAAVGSVTYKVPITKPKKMTLPPKKAVPSPKKVK
jgi:hypothetical protein